MTEENTTETAINAVELATELTTAWLSNSHNRINAEDVPAFLQSMHQAVSALSPNASPAPVEEAPKEYAPAVTIKKSLADPAFIVSLIDGKPYKALKRHLGANGLTPAEYRARYGLKDSYPMTAPAYSDARRATALRLGLGRKAKVTEGAVEEAAPNPEPKPARKSRKSASDAAKAHLAGE